MTFILKSPLAALTTATALSVSVLLATTTLSSAQEAVMKRPAVISVNASGETTAKPDMAIVNLGVVTEGSSANEALLANNEAMKKAIDAMKASGIEERDLQTSNFSIYPVYDKNSSYKKLTDKKNEYRVSNSLTVRVRDLSKLGTILDESVKLGVNSSSNLTLTNADPKPYTTQARKNAVIEARERAETLADAAGVKLGRVLIINEGNAQFAPIQQRGMMMADSAAGARAPVPIASGELEYNVNVMVTFEIAQ